MPRASESQHHGLASASAPSPSESPLPPCFGSESGVRLSGIFLHELQSRSHEEHEGEESFAGVGAQRLRPH